MEEQDKQLLNDVLASENFSDQEKQIIKGRFEKAEKREALLIKCKQGIADGTMDIGNVINAVMEMTDENCEHGRDMMGTCSDCFYLEKKVAHLHPEQFRNDPSCADLFSDDEEIIN